MECSIFLSANIKTFTIETVIQIINDEDAQMPDIRTSVEKGNERVAKSLKLILFS